MSIKCGFKAFPVKKIIVRLIMLLEPVDDDHNMYPEVCFVVLPTKNLTIWIILTFSNFHWKIYDLSPTKNLRIKIILTFYNFH